MSLATYKKKRKPKETPEPMPRSSKDGDLIFVIQKHQASHLHYDFRLEVDGVLKSWAVPKGPPVHSDEKRLAIMVEDHPYAYKDFSGVIPKGNYGAGNVTIWDEGTYTVPGATSIPDAEKRMRAGIKKGHVVVLLVGERLQGEFHLVKTLRNGQEKSWLFFQKTTEKKRQDKKPAQVAPMLAQLVDKPFNQKGWIFEVKWDGYRTIANVEKTKVKLSSRNQNSFNRQFATIVKELSLLAEHAPILDGEVVVLDEKGRSRFQLLQKYLKTGEGSLVYYVFDLLYCDGQDLREWPLLERKERLEVLLAPLRNSHIRYSDHIEEKGVRFFAAAKKLELEGILAKNAQSKYQMRRSSDWRKIKTQVRLEVFIGGFTEPRNSREHFGSLMVGVIKNKKRVYVGQVGSGFSDADLKTLFDKFSGLLTKGSPFVSHPKLDSKPTYIKPLLRCEVSFTEWTEDGLMRHPVFEGLKDADES